MKYKCHKKKKKFARKQCNTRDNLMISIIEFLKDTVALFLSSDPSI